MSSTRRGLSSMSHRSRVAALTVLKRTYSDVCITIVNDLSDLKALSVRNPDLVFLGMKFIPRNPELGARDPEKIWIADFLDEHEIAYTGSDQAAHVLELNKPAAKQCVLDAGLGSSPYFVAEQNSGFSELDMPSHFPVFIKPTNRGGGLGVDAQSIAHNIDQAQTKVSAITAELQSDSLIEKYIPGREFSVAILKNDLTADYDIMPIELVAEANQQGERLLSGDMKSSNDEVVSAVIDNQIKDDISDLAIDVFHALGARDYGRIDIRLDGEGRPLFLEANLIPSLISGYGSFPKSCEINLVLGYEDMILQIVRLGLLRTKNVFDVNIEEQSTIAMDHQLLTV